MKIAEIWRYPVKTMAGEKLQRVRLGPLGIEGDRVVHVEDAQGQVITSRSHPRFLGHKGALGLDGEPLVDGWPWNSPEVAAKVVDIVGPGAKLVRYEIRSVTSGTEALGEVSVHIESGGRKVLGRGVSTILYVDRYPV